MSHSWFKSLLWVGLLQFLALSSFALSPEKRLPEELEKRARVLFSQVRCLVCEGQVIESSSTEFSFGMRQLIREKISEGKSDREIKSELVKEFGDDVLLNPRPKSFVNIILWLIPALFAFLLIKFMAIMPQKSQKI